MNRAFTIALLLCSAAALEPWAKFFADYFERWLTNPDVVLSVPWFVWTELVVASVKAAVITAVAYLTMPDKKPKEPTVT